MPDRGARYADKSIVKVIRSLRKTYAQAQKELESKLKDFNKRFEEKDKKKRQELADGKITEQQYKDWLSGQVFTRRQIENKIKQVSAVMLDYNNQAMNIVNNSRLDVFAENYYSEAFRAQYIVNDLSFNVYNTQAIADLIKNNPQILPKWKINEEKDYKWNYQKFNNIIQQGIIQGESVDQITKRLCKDLSSQNENKMRMFARTGITEAQNAGRQEQMNQAADMGIEVNKRWLATHDERTRDSHRAMDGEEVPYDEKFSNGLEYPGDPSGSAAEVYNCRCTIVTIYPKYEDRSKKYGEDVTIDGQSYEEWKQGKQNANKVVQTGGKYAIYSKKWIENQEKRDLQAEKFYERVRNSDDIQQVAKASGFTSRQISIIKDHIFRNDKHKLYDGVGRFPADYDMAVAWKRLSEGKPEKRDILLLKHELLEARLEKRYNLTVADAHARAKKRYPWDDVLFEMFGEDGEEDDLL